MAKEKEPTVTRILYSKNLNDGKYQQLKELARRLGQLRAEIWRDYGSLRGVGLQQRALRDSWLAEKRQFSTPARLWKETLRSTMGDITMYREAAKVQVRSAVHRTIVNDDQRKTSYNSLKSDTWVGNKFLARQMRKHFRHGVTRVRNQIVLDSDCYTTFSLGGRAWLKVMGLERGHRIAIPLNTTVEPSGTLRLILRGGRVEVHYAVSVKQACSIKPCGEATIGIDKGYTEVYVDSDGERYGKGFGQELATESDFLNEKNKRRNKIRAIAKKHQEKGKHGKAKRIFKNNLGRKKAKRRMLKFQARMRDKVFQATHQVVSKAKTIAAEDLSKPFSSDNGAKINRRLSAWRKGTMAEALESVSKRRGSALLLVNAAYTSQMDSQTGLLLGSRKGDSFYRVNGDVVDADINAAKNVLARLYDNEINLYTPYRKVKAVLQERTLQTGALRARLGLLNHDISCNGSQIKLPLSTMSEEPIFYM